VYGLPLYETVFHASVVATDRWDVPTRKFPSLLVRRQLLELLYGAPSIWAMDRRELKDSQGVIARLAGFFEPLHNRLGTIPLESFEWLTADRLVQRTRFGSEIILTANFGSSAYTGVKSGCIHVRLGRWGEVQTFCP